MKLLKFVKELDEINKQTIEDLDDIWVVVYSGGAIYVNNYNASEYFAEGEKAQIYHRMYLDTNPETSHTYCIDVLESSDFSKSKLKVIKLFIELIETGVENIDIDEYMNALEENDKNLINYKEWKQKPYGFDRNDDNSEEVTWFE